MLSCEFCEISKNCFFTEHLWATVSVLYGKMLCFFFDQSLISANQSGFKPVGFGTNQLLSINLNIYKSFNNGYELRDVFLDTSKAFDKA